MWKKDAFVFTLQKNKYKIRDENSNDKKKRNISCSKIAFTAEHLTILSFFAEQKISQRHAVPNWPICVSTAANGIFADLQTDFTL